VPQRLSTLEYAEYSDSSREYYEYRNAAIGMGLVCAISTYCCG
jgi:hypothetical protein